MLDKKKVAYDVFLLRSYQRIVSDITLGITVKNCMESSDFIFAMLIAMDPILDKLRDCFADDLPVYESEGEDDGDH